LQNIAFANDTETQQFESGFRKAGGEQLERLRNFSIQDIRYWESEKQQTQWKRKTPQRGHATGPKQTTCEREQKTESGKG